MSTINLLLASDLHLDSERYDLSGPICRLEDCGGRVEAAVLAGDIVDVAGEDPVAHARGMDREPAANCVPQLLEAPANCAPWATGAGA